MSTWTVSTGSPGRLRSFDPLRIGDLEYRMWVSYYRRQWLRVLLAAVRLAWLGFGADWLLILQTAALLMRAVLLWAPFPDNDAEGAHACMSQLYGLIRLSLRRAGGSGPGSRARAQLVDGAPGAPVRA